LRARAKHERKELCHLEGDHCLSWIMKQEHKFSSSVDDRSIHPLKSLASQGAGRSSSLLVSPQPSEILHYGFYLALKISVKLLCLHMWTFWEIWIWCGHMKLTF